MSFNFKIQQTVTRIVAETKHLTNIDLQRALIKQAPFHRGHVALWNQYGLEIFKQTGMKMFGQKYNNKLDPTKKRKNNVQNPVLP